MRSELGADECRGFIAELAELLPGLLGGQSSDPMFAPLIEEDASGRRKKWDPVFTGGAIVGLLISDAAARPPSKTKDIDLVLEIVGYMEFAAVESKLRGSGFSQNPLENVAWSWKNIRVDFLPHLPMERMVNTNRWFPHLINEAEWREVTPGRFAWLASAPCFIATKFEAFFSRGKGNYLESKDIEDIIAIVDGREELMDEIALASPEIRQFVRASFGGLLETSDFIEAISQIVPDEFREGIVIERMREISVRKF